MLKVIFDIDLKLQRLRFFPVMFLGLLAACGEAPQPELSNSPFSKDSLNLQKQASSEMDAVYYNLKTWNLSVLLQAIVAQAAREEGVTTSGFSTVRSQPVLPQCVRRISLDRYQWENCQDENHRFSGQHQVVRRTDGSLERIELELRFAPLRSPVPSANSTSNVASAPGAEVGRGFVWVLEFSDIAFAQRRIEGSSANLNTLTGQARFLQFRGGRNLSNLFQHIQVDGLVLEYGAEGFTAMDYSGVLAREVIPQVSAQSLQQAPLTAGVSTGAPPQTSSAQEIEIKLYASGRMPIFPEGELPNGLVPYSATGRVQNVQGDVETTEYTGREVRSGVSLNWPCRSLCFMH